ncbi:Adenylate and Guanylate cyclase catalytic domain containing protein [Trichomonas vaginalis G3]|uniref:Adenylate and Guanylate cyclase catalytic domain containing protein n=1 Tax=Trichomonas vaginalis (strain ATCC PRA-98 / G3) TaxID=412133 RepID=A2DXT3_TRIV3|nr:guanylate cyclase protein [Trichomonas vaginalis G3]EAY14793.1 Adenylate and Guanylate cyclase catalytic domain containing protein [Trichomonas vaginalis G3]KAI5508068.1 guanylate cyclase protein [Trichomonas vaginalis G3]|eukprot:XP_001327016.1 Adenylate and Guanylate cyclase catalytic domain containing protein [Trichomonas vaginalis G3]
MAEASVSRSMSSVSTTLSVAQKIDSLLQGDSGLIDKIFPILDQVMQKTKYPGWLMGVIAIFLLNQILSVTLWVYTPIFRRSTGTWYKFYKVLIEIFSFQDPLNYDRTDGISLTITIVVAVFSVIWFLLMILYNNKFYQIPTALLYITSFILDMVDPLFIMPSIYVINHGITSLRFKYSGVFVTEIIIGAVSYAIFITIFLINTFLKSRSVVLTNFLFPLFDHFSITTWVVATSMFSVLSAIFEYFQHWIYCVAAILHIFLTIYICYRLMFIPFYEVWRNAICLSYGFTTIALDINFIVIYANPSFTYNYTIFVYIGVIFIGYAIAKYYFMRMVKKIKKDLTFDEDISNIQEYFDSIRVGRSSLYAMMYIVVGLSEVADYFIDGSLTDYILNLGTLDSAVSILLQVVTFFPSESRKMGVLYKKVVSKRRLDITDRFLIYQVYRIKMRRLVSDTKDTLEIFNKLRQRNEDCKQIINGFWDKQDCNQEYLSSLSILVNDIDAHFKSVLANNPNNLRITNEYANFLIECRCEFNQAVKESVIADSIGNGRNFNVDVSFRSVVNKFPRYLKDKILDTKGKRITQKGLDRKKNSSQFSSQNGSQNSSNNSSLTRSLSVDFERQEFVCKKILRDSKVRLAFHNAVSETRPWQADIISVLMAFNVALTIVFFIGFYGFMKQRVSWRRSSYRDLENACYTIFYNILSDVYTLNDFAYQSGRYDNNAAVLGDISIDNGVTSPLVPDTLDMPDKIYYCLDHSRSYLEKFLDQLAVLALDNNPYTIAPDVLYSRTNFTYCDNGTAADKIPTSLKDQLITIDYLQNVIAGTFKSGEKIDNLYINNEYCEIAVNIHTVATYSDQTFQNILNYNIQESKDYKKEFLSWLIVGACVIFFGISLPAVIVIKTYNKMVDDMIRSLISLPCEVKEDAKKPLMLEYEDSSMHVSSQKLDKSYIMKILQVLFFFFIFCAVAVYVLLCYEAIILNDDITMILKWFHYSCSRIVLGSEIGVNVIQTILLNGSLPQTIVNVSFVEETARKDLDKLLTYNHALIYGNENISRSIGFDKKFDEMQLQNVCELDHDPKTIHDMYACSSIDSQVQIFKNMVVDVLNNPAKYQGNLNSEVAENMMHLLRNHFYPSVVKATERIAALMEEFYDRKMNLEAVFVVLGFICLIFILVLPAIFKVLVLNNYANLMMLFQHLPPQTILNSPEIMKFFTGKKKNSGDEKMPVSKAIVYDANECIIITNQASVIEILNKSVAENIGLTPDQMLGQQIANFVSTEDQPRLNKQIDLMVNGQGPAIWEDHLTLLDEDSQAIPFAATMIGMKDNENSTTFNSIVFILTNEQEEIQKRKEAEEAKAKSEKLLYQILPKDIVIRLNRGETDISFTIKSATIFFVDIVKFSAYTALLTPTDIMANLSLVFATYDQIVSQYDLITKIKLIGDDYMAAAGLFMKEDDDPKKHAEQAVRCCIQISKALDEINAKLNASLEVRIGCNSGGPLIGGVLGTDKPTFDIIGDPINVAARLQSTDVPGNVQISGETKELIQDLDFNIEERGEVFLKGKGNRMTYFVSLAQKVDPEGSFVVNLN